MNVCLSFVVEKEPFQIVGSVVFTGTSSIAVSLNVSMWIDAAVCGFDFTICLLPIHRIEAAEKLQNIKIFDDDTPPVWQERTNIQPQIYPFGYDMTDYAD